MKGVLWLACLGSVAASPLLDQEPNLRGALESGDAGICSRMTFAAK